MEYNQQKFTLRGMSGNGEIKLAANVRCLKQGEKKHRKLTDAIQNTNASSSNRETKKDSMPPQKKESTIAAASSKNVDADEDLIETQKHVSLFFFPEKKAFKRHVWLRKTFPFYRVERRVYVTFFHQKSRV